MTNPHFDWTEGQKVPGVIMNPGTGPVHGSTDTDGRINMVKLCEDAGVLDQLDMPEAIVRRDDVEGIDGRLRYDIKLGDRTCEVDMPGIPLLGVRYTGGPGQSILDYPRLYVDGSSWVWPYAVNSVRESLTGDREED